MPTDECHRTLLMISQHWFRWWLGAVMQQAITSANVDSFPCRLMASLGHIELKQYPSAKCGQGLKSFWDTYLLSKGNELEFVHGSHIHLEMTLNILNAYRYQNTSFEITKHGDNNLCHAVVKMMHNREICKTFNNDPLLSNLIRSFMD